MIVVNTLTRRYGDTVALQDVSARIEQGEIVGLLGHNGAGKTTMMKVLTGYLDPSAGSASVAGFDVVRQRRQVQRRIGYLPESAPLYPEMTVSDYLLGMAALRGVHASERVEAVARAVEATGLHGRLTQTIGTLSKGLRQRVGLAQAIVHRPQVLILDEPTNGLDPSQIESMRALIRDLAKTSTVLLSTHILQEVEAVCDRVLVLVGGRLVADGKLEDLTRTTQLQVSIASDEAAAVLGEVQGVRAVHRTGADPLLPGFTAYTLDCDPSLPSLPGPAVAARLQREGIALGTLAPRRRRLEETFADLSEVAA